MEKIVQEVAQIQGGCSLRSVLKYLNDLTSMEDNNVEDSSSILQF
jgi:hypothetical protein